MPIFNSTLTPHPARLSLYDVPLILFFVSAVLGLWPAYAPERGYASLAAMTGGVVLYFLVSRLHSASRAVQWLTNAFLVLCVLFSVYFITQAGNLNYDDKVEVISRLAGAISHYMPNLAIWKPMSNSAGTFLESSLFLAIGLGLAVRKSREKWLYLLTAAIMAIALIFSSSRGAWLAVLGAGLIWLAFYWKPAAYMAFGVLAGLGALILFTIIRHDINVLNQVPIINSVIGPLFIRPDRLEVYRNSLALIADVPFSGIGLGDQFALVYSRYELLIQVPFLYYSHNLFLEVWLEQGLMGITTWLWLVAAILSSLWAYRRRIQNQIAEATWIGLLAVFLHGVSDARQYEDLWCWLPFFFLLGLNASYLRQSEDLPRSSKILIMPAATVGIFLVSFVLIFSPLQSTFTANLASLVQQRADLAPSLLPNERSSLLNLADSGLKQALLANPSSRSANQRLGLIAFDRGDYPNAIRSLETALQADPLHPGTRKALGLSYAINQDFNQAVPLLKGVPNILDELNTWGWYFSTNNRKTAGLNAYRMSLKLSPAQPAIQDAAEKLSRELHP